MFRDLVQKYTRLFQLLPIKVHQDQLIFPLLFLQFSAWDYVRILYESVLGVLIMSVCLVVYVIALFWSGYIMEIQV